MLKNIETETHSEMFQMWYYLFYQSFPEDVKNILHRVEYGFPVSNENWNYFKTQIDLKVKEKIKEILEAYEIIKNNEDDELALAIRLNAEFLFQFDFYYENVCHVRYQALRN